MVIILAFVHYLPDSVTAIGFAFKHIIVKLSEAYIQIFHYVQLEAIQQFSSGNITKLLYLKPMK